MRECFYFEPRHTVKFRFNFHVVNSSAWNRSGYQNRLIIQNFVCFSAGGFELNDLKLCPLNIRFGGLHQFLLQRIAVDSIFLVKLFELRFGRSNLLIQTFKKCLFIII